KLAFYGCIVGGIVAQLSLMGVFSEREITLDHRISFADIGVNAVAISIGYMLILGIVYLFSKGQPILLKVIAIASCFIMFYFILRTGTRSGVFGVLGALGLAYIFSFKVNYLNLFKFAVFTSILFFSFQFLLSNYVGSRLTERILSVGSEDIEGDSRNQLWSVAYDYFSHHIFGTGAGNESVAYIEYGIGPREAHNVFLSSLLQLGFPG